MTKEKSTVKKVGSRFRNLDMFGVAPGFSVAGSSTMTSYCGACTSIIVIVVVSFFAFVRFQTMLEYGETMHQKTTNSMVIDD